VNCVPWSVSKSSHFLKWNRFRSNLVRIRVIECDHFWQKQPTQIVVCFGINALVVSADRKSVLVRYVSALAAVVHGFCQRKKGFYRDGGK
jgi:hypothetical protein